VDTRRVGELGERIAESYLALKGFQIVRRNVVVARREIDLLFRSGPYLVAVEVKLRRGGAFGTAVEAVDRRKLARVQLALEGLLASAGSRLMPRVDLVVIDVQDDTGRMVVEHIEAVY
jgi:putative endonuclease